MSAGRIAYLSGVAAMLALAACGAAEDEVAEAPPPETQAPADAPEEPAAEDVADVPSNGGEQPVSLCYDGSDTLCSTMPATFANVQNGYTGLTADQNHFDYFSWQAFIALNWPLTDNSTPRIWESYQTPGEVFDPEQDFICPNDGTPVFDLDSKIEKLDRSTSFMEAFSGPLIDVNGNFAVYDIRVNDVWYEYVHGAGLDTLSGQINFDPSTCPPGAEPSVCFTMGEGATATEPEQLGAMEIKSSWMLVPQGQETTYAGEYFTIEGNIGLDATETSTGQAECIQGRTLALVGMHIIVRTTGDGADWLWGTFEHKNVAPFTDNSAAPFNGAPLAPFAANKGSVPDAPHVNTCTAAGASGSYDFFNTSCTEADGSSCPVNTQPAQPPGQQDYHWNMSTPDQYASDYLNNGFGTQATRCWAIYDATAQTNTAFQNAIRQLDANNVWANYELMGTQWAHLTDTFPAATNIVPAYLANATMETYFQTSSSCFSCHEGAKLAGNNDISANFSWLLNRDIHLLTGESPPVPEEFREGADPE